MYLEEVRIQEKLRTNGMRGSLRFLEGLMSILRMLGDLENAWKEVMGYLMGIYLYVCLLMSSQFTDNPITLSI